MNTCRPAVFLDRDGTLIEDVGYPNNPDRVALLPGVAQAMRSLQAAQFPLIVLSNQSGVARGIITTEQARQVHERFIELFRREGVEFTGTYYCPHRPEDDCECRKPNPGMLLQAADEWNLDIKRSVMVGDRMGDIEAGKRAGCRAILFRSQYVKPSDDLSLADSVVSDWEEAYPILLEMMNRYDA